ncbi:FAD-binding oxidoreductase [Actinoplanes sp. NPDC026619]|uniref:FAD-binding oxidoreductase n=1 Tax=Actinoplanes sp. NPDC026619 TaxID=3155798 RepID=UPI0033F699A7
MRLVRPNDPGYDADRRVWNAMHDRRPALIAHCDSVADVVAAVRLAQDQNLEIAVRGGGHSMPGFSTVDDGIVIALDGLRAITVDPARRVLVAEGGALLGDVDRAAQEHGMVVPAGVISHTGVAGLTLGGGVGRLMRRFGLTIDSLLAAEVVTAAGDVVTATETENPDLFWALRGGGGNFGVVTKFTYRTHELTTIPVLACFHSLDDAPRVLARAQETIADPATPRELLWTSFFRKGHPLPWMPPALVGTPGLMTVIEWSGDVDEGMKLLGEMRDELAPIAATVDPVPFLTLQTAGDEMFRHGLHTYVKAGFTAALTPALVAELIERGRLIGSEISQIELLAQGGAIADVATDATAYPHRTADWLVNIPASWVDPADGDSELAWVRASYAAVRPHLDGTSYSNFMDADEASDEQTAYGSTLRRLQRVKAQWDPANVFHLNQNVKPA